MVFRGKPSKACERCRARRLKCDFLQPGCSPCARARLACSGYRDTDRLRVQNETQSTTRKLSRAKPVSAPQYLPLSIDFQARDAFFGYYVSESCWDFLQPYHHSIGCPEHLKLAIEAVSLAYLWHYVYSDVALAHAREKYISALRVLNKTLSSSMESLRVTTLLASLVLDLFQKITDLEPRDNDSWMSHANGALALVKTRGIEKFEDPSDVGMLFRLSTNYIIGCVASGSPVLDKLDPLQNFFGTHSGGQTQHVRPQLSDLVVQYANLRSEVEQGRLSAASHIQRSVKLDADLEAHCHELPSSWQYSTVVLERPSDRVFDLHFDVYRNPRARQAWNILRIIRILLNRDLIEECLASPLSEKISAMVTKARNVIKTLVNEICTSAPQYLICGIAAGQSKPSPEADMLISYSPDHMLDRAPLEMRHSHTHKHQQDCYTLIFPLYVAGVADANAGVKAWVIQQLDYMGYHFGIRNAAVVAQILEQGASASPWKVYAMLGSYAFTV